MFISALKLDILIWESMGTDTLLEPLVGVFTLSSSASGVSGSLYMFFLKHSTATVGSKSEVCISATELHATL